jgi:hypothetical protein
VSFNKSIIIAKTFTPYYSPVEDRIRLVLNYADYTNRVDFWITRAFMLKLLPTWEEYLYRYGNSKQISSSKPSSQNPSGISATNGSTLAVTEKNGVLLESVEMRFDTSSGRFKIRMSGRGAESMALLDEWLMMEMIKSIFAVAPHLQWGISPALLDS